MNVAGAECKVNDVEVGVSDGERGVNGGGLAEDVLGGGGEGVPPALSDEDMEWLEDKRKKGKRRKRRKDVSAPEPGRVEVSNAFEVFSEVEGGSSSGDESVISMEEESQGVSKRVGSPTREGGKKAKKRVPQSS